MDYVAGTLPRSTADWQAVEDFARGWLASRSVVALLAYFGFKQRSDNFEDNLSELLQFSTSNFDFRRGNRERWETDEIEFDSEVAILIRAVYEDFSGPNQPLSLTPDSEILVLGGQLRSCMARSELARVLADEFDGIECIWGLGSRRPVVQREIDLAQKLHLPPLRDELDAMSQGLASIFGLQITHSTDARSGEEVRSLAEAPIPIRALAAIAPDGRRATTKDTYEFYIRASSARNGSKLPHPLLLLTSDIYIPFQYFQAVQIFRNHDLQIAGVTWDASQNPLLHHKFQTRDYLQEFHSTLRSLSDLQQARSK